MGLLKTILTVEQILVGFSSEEKNKNLLLNKLQEYNTTPESVTHLVCSHGHSDHIGNLNLFPNAIIYLGNDILNPNQAYDSHDFQKTDKLVIEKYETDKCDNSTNTIYLLATPGHTDHCLSLVVENADRKTIVVAGDLFENELDLVNENLWRDNSRYPDLQQKSRQKVLEIADFIIPGHGKIFKILQ